MTKNGFSQIEILVVIILAMLLIGLDIFVVITLNTKQKDVQVLSEISQIRSGLEVFLLNNNYYPAATDPVALNDNYAKTEKLCLEGFRNLQDSCQKIILNPIPNSTFSLGNQYLYKSTDNNKNYQVEFVLQTDFKNQGLLRGKNCATNSQIVSQPCF